MKIGFIKRLFSFLICIVITAVSIPITAFEAFGLGAILQDNLFLLTPQHKVRI